MQLRYAEPDEFASIAELDGASFGISYSPVDIEDAKLDVELDRILVTVDDDRMVGVSAEVPFELTLPGGAVDVVGLTWVSVDVTHRRRGVLRRMIEQQVRTCPRAALILTASEGGIYGRYGFGAATTTAKTVVDRHRTTLMAPVAEHRVRRITNEQARDELPPIYDRWRRAHPGALDRSAQRWRLELLDREWQRRGASQLHHLVHADGYVSYRIRSNWTDGHPAGAVSIVDYVICSEPAHAALWQVLLGMDLCTTIESFRVPVDDPLPLLVTDPRQVRHTDRDDGLWVRPVDVARLLSERRYATPVDHVLGVIDPLLGDGAYRLVGGPDGAECRVTTDQPDVALDVAALGAVVLGGSRLTVQAAAGLVRGEPRIVSSLDRALLADRAPEYGTHF